MIQIQNISYKYPGAPEKVFDGLTLSFNENQIYGLLGRNGVGKSTLLYLLAGLLHPRKGQITIDGHEPRHRQPDLLQEVCFVPDEFSFPQLTLNQYVNRYAPFYPRFSRAVLQACAADFQVPLHQPLHRSSLGQKKRVMIAFALATQCRVLLMDEPTNALDIPAKALFRKLVARYAAQGQTILLSTHQVHDIDALLDHVVVMGRVERQNGEEPHEHTTDHILFDHSMADVERRYAFVYRSMGEDCSDALYSEPTPQGKALIVENRNGQNTTVNLELLFNAVVKGVLRDGTPETNKQL